MQSKQYRKDIADLLRSGKQDYARIRVEAVIRETLSLTAYEILELYLELLAVRAPLIANSKEIPRDMVEALSSILYASRRMPDLQELETLYKMFAAKYGKEYVTEASNDVTCSRWNVNDNLRRCLTVEPPEPTLKLQTLSDIAQEYGVEWDMDRARRELLPDFDMPMGGGGYGDTGGPYSVYSTQHTGAAAGGPSHPIAAPPPAAPAAAAAGRPGGGYADAQAAAAAAAAAAREANAAADYAARYANQGGGGGGGGGTPTAAGFSGNLPGSPSAAAAAAAAPGRAGAAPPPPMGWLSGGALPGGPAIPDSLATANSSGSGVSGYNHAPPPAAPDLGPYKVRSQDEIQRAYDAAAGPPSKGAVAPADGPGAPPPGAATAGGGSDGGSQSAGEELPAPPPPITGTGSRGNGGPVSEYDELQKRFEALKKS